ncbi:Type IV secretory system Conjugative DNA transfer [Catalinimonas alkaloidigena]|uniref:Type IV secretory system Conjugative DNA transfer n=1 Tax=Catalinimonas alkaloidigena TaxID=1075417 RepID=A0A1G9U4G8_9BACT|nr:type IV secretory system conjugative DNA transfer family protein [Catalinimonas alkaloidigena]SDM54564.1 Type IV secretory system Conjugative DNA transfer [Catalinimonas alkaloidigena]
MEETSELKKLYALLQAAVYVLVLLDAAVFVLAFKPFMPTLLVALLHRLARIPVFDNVLYIRLSLLVVIGMVSVGTKARKNLHFRTGRYVVAPLVIGLLLLFGSVPFYHPAFAAEPVLAGFAWSELVYMLGGAGGALLTHLALDNLSKRVQSSLLKDKFNVENESFQQPQRCERTEYSVNIPMLFYWKGKVRKGWLNVANPFRGLLLFGTPGSGKTFGIINPCIKQMLSKGFSLLVYDFKHPDLGKVAYHHYRLHHQQGKPLAHHAFHVINLDEVEKSRRVNPLRADYIQTMADAYESAEALVEALRRGDRARGSDQFFTQSAVNFLTAVIYFLARYQQGRYSTLAHVLAFLNLGYEELFSTLFQEAELEFVLSPFESAYRNKAYEQLEGQIGTVRVQTSRLLTKESCWVFTGDDVPLALNDPRHPSVLILANNPATQSINSACYSVVLNRITRLINRKGGCPSGIIADEFPTVYFHKIENLIATARSNRVATVLGLQDLPQLKAQYGKETADVLTSVPAHVLSGKVNHRETLDWLEKLFGKVKQVRGGLSIDRNRTTSSLNEHSDALIPAHKIADLKAGELVGKLAYESDRYTGQYQTSNLHCKVNLSLKEVAEEEQKYQDLPRYYNFGDAQQKQQRLLAHLLQVKQEVKQITQQAQSHANYAGNAGQ